VSSAADRREENWNAASHGVGFLAAVVVLPIAIIEAIHRGGAYHIIGVSIFGASMVLTLGASALYHAATDRKRKRVLRILDHASIFLLIAGSYTPICLTTLRGPWGWSLLGTVWGVAAFGIVMKLKYTGRFDLLSTFLYLAMGWAALVAIVPIFDQMESKSLVFLFGAGLCFTTGVAFYLLDHRPMFHFAWHLFVMGGCICLYGVVFTELP
jgi:hemolysin III